MKASFWILQIIVLLSFTSCVDRNVEVFKGKEACSRFLPMMKQVPMVAKEGNKTKFLFLNTFTQTKYECEYVIVNGRLNVEKSVFKVTKDCDMEKEEAKVFDYLLKIKAQKEIKDGDYYISPITKEQNEVYGAILEVLYGNK